MTAEPLVDCLTDPTGARGVLRDAAEGGPTAIDTSTGAVWVLHYEEIDRLAHDARLIGVGLTWFDVMGIDDGDLRQWYGALMFTNEGDTHGRLRRLVSQAFTPRSAERLRDTAASMVGEEFDRLEARGGGDLVRAFGRLPMRVMCRLLGVPEEDVIVFGDWADALSPVFGFMDPTQIEAAGAAVVALLGYVAELVEARRDDPAEDLITALLQAESEGDRLTHDELVAMVANLLVGGHDTTASQIGCTLLTLFRYPDAIDAVRTGRASLASAVSETIRYEPSIPLIPRTAAAPIEIGGTERPVGTSVLLSLMTANRDSAVWDDAEAFRADRFDSASSPRLLSFGTGAHYCLGANLARMTLEEVLRGLSMRAAKPLTDLDAVQWRMILGRSPVALDVAIV